MIPGLTPGDIGLPPKFSDWRSNQILALERGLDSLHRFQAHSMPVGDGKSAYYVAQALLSSKRACILTSTKGLQKQLHDDFHSIGLQDMRGRNNYPCIVKDCRNCEEGQYHRCDPADCAYEQARNRMLLSPLVSSNYSYFTRSYKYGRGMGEFDLLVCDEAHDCPDEVCAAMAVEVAYWEAAKIGINLPRDGSLEDWHDWADLAMPVVTQHVEELKAAMESDKLERGRAHISTIKDFRFWNAVQFKVAAILEATGQWAIERIGDGYRLEPVWAADYANQILFLDIPKIILVSATMVKKTIHLLGIKDDQIDFYEYRSSFPAERSPVYIYPTTGSSGRPLQINFRTTEDDYILWMARIDNIIRRRLDRKGIIHSVSYDRSKWIRDHSEFSANMIVPEKGAQTAACLEQFYHAGPGAILVSPAITTGLDLKYSLAEYNLIVKVPFLDVRGAVLSARQETDKDYAPYITAQTIVQASGRTMRAGDDQSECFILDANINWFLQRHSDLFPFWFHRLVSRPRVAPEPPAPLNRHPELSTLNLEEAEAQAQQLALSSISNVPKSI